MALRDVQLADFRAIAGSDEGRRVRSGGVTARGILRTESFPVLETDGSPGSMATSTSILLPTADLPLRNGDVLEVEVAGAWIRYRVVDRDNPPGRPGTNSALTRYELTDA